MTDLLVTGTDHAVGKTVVAAALVLALRHMGVRAVGFKPAETGVGRDGALADSEVLAVASGVDVLLARPLLRLEEPLAPALAAERAGKTVDPGLVEERIRGLRAAGHATVVEGVGGVLVPLAWDYTVIDLATRLGLEAVVVGRAGQGAQNHLALTVEALRRREVKIRGLVLNFRGDLPSVAETTSPGIVEKLLPGLPLVVVPRHPTSTPLAVARSAAGLMGKLL